MDTYCVMTCDVKHSRTLSDWPAVVDKLTRCLRNLNTKFRPYLAVRFRFTVGDEFQGVLNTPDKLYDIYLYIKTHTPVDIYCGIGIGEAEISGNKPTNTRGSAFYRAREALNFCKKNKRSIYLRSADTENMFDKLVNTLLYVIETLENGWTNRQREIITYYRLHPDYTYEKIGKHFGISRQSVYQILKSANWQIINRSETLVNELLHEFVRLKCLTNGS